MKHIRKRLLASVTAMMLVCSMLPVSALAAEDETAELESPVAVEAAAVVPAEPALAEPEAAPAEPEETPAEAPEKAEEEPTEAPTENDVTAETEEPEQVEETPEAEEAAEPAEEEAAETIETESAEPAAPEETEVPVKSVGSAVTYDAEAAEQETAAAASAAVTLADELEVPVFIVSDDGKTYTVGKSQSIQDIIDHINTLEDKEGYTIVVPSGTYGRFTILDGMNGLTVKGEEGAEVIINVVDNSDAPAATSGAYPDTAGVSIRYANNVTLQNLKFQLGVQNNPWYSAAVSNYSESGNKGNNFTIDGCTFLGADSENPAGIGVFVNTGTTKFTVKNSTFAGLQEAISMYGDGTTMEGALVDGNKFENNSFALHGYYGGSSEGAGELKFMNNKVTGSDTLRQKIVIQDQINSGAIKVIVAGNDLENALVGLVNLREDGENLFDVLKYNTMGKGTFYVEAIEPGTIEFYTTYFAPEQGNGHWELTGKDDFDVDWGKNPNGSTAYIQDIVDRANASKDKKLVITGIDENNLIKTFTWFKDGIYWVTDPDEEPEPEPPVEPTEPEPKPPVEPTEPEPESPVEPTTPEGPTTPEEPTESEIVEPLAPVEPEVVEPEVVETAVETETEPTDNGLPQTGQDWAVVAVIALAGAAVLTFGLKRRKTANEN